MKKIILLLLITISLNLYATKYAGEIFTIGAGVENYALGNTGLTNLNSPALAYWNPALSDKANNQMELMHAEEFGGLLKLDTFSAIFGKNNPYSFVITKISVSDIPLTKWDETYNRPYSYKNASTTDLIAYFGFKTTFRNIKMGFTPKLVYRKLINVSGFGFGGDISTYYKISPNWLFAAKIKDFFTTQILWNDGIHEIIYPSVSLENSYSFIIPKLKKKLTFFLMTDFLFENRKFASTVHFGAASMDFHAGLKTEINQKLSLLLGYDIKNPTAGLTFRIGKFKINYSFEQNTSLNNSHRVSIGYGL